VYAERVECAGSAPSAGARAPRSPGRTAFHYGDIAALLDAAQQA